MDSACGAMPLFLCVCPLIEDLHADPYERATMKPLTTDHWLIDRVYLLVPAQAYVGQFLMTVQGFPAAAEASQLQSGSGDAEAAARH